MKIYALLGYYEANSGNSFGKELPMYTGDLICFAAKD
jgi:hypothetical protein